MSPDAKDVRRKPCATLLLMREGPRPPKIPSNPDEWEAFANKEEAERHIGYLFDFFNLRSLIGEENLSLDDEFDAQAYSEVIMKFDVLDGIIRQEDMADEEVRDDYEDAAEENIEWLIDKKAIEAVSEGHYRLTELGKSALAAIGSSRH